MLIHQPPAAKVLFYMGFKAKSYSKRKQAIICFEVLFNLANLETLISVFLLLILITASFAFIHVLCSTATAFCWAFAFTNWHENLFQFLWELMKTILLRRWVINLIFYVYWWILYTLWEGFAAIVQLRSRYLAIRPSLMNIVSDLVVDDTGGRHLQKALAVHISAK